MKKLIIIKDDSKIQVGDIIQYENKLYTVRDLGGYPEENNGSVYIKTIGYIRESWISKVHLYIVDTEVEIEVNDWVAKRNTIGQVLQGHDMLRLMINKSSVNWNHHKAYQNKIIATTNTSLQLPELSMKSIDLIIEKNGVLGEFDIEIKEVEGGIDEDRNYIYYDLAYINLNK